MVNIIIIHRIIRRWRKGKQRWLRTRILQSHFKYGYSTEIYEMFKTERWCMSCRYTHVLCHYGRDCHQSWSSKIRSIVVIIVLLLFIACVISKSLRGCPQFSTRKSCRFLTERRSIIPFRSSAIEAIKRENKELRRSAWMVLCDAFDIIRTDKRK